VLLFTLALTVGTGILFGLVPAWKMSQVSPQGALKDTSQVGGSLKGQRLLDAIAIAEVALAMVLLIAGGLLLRSFVRLVQTPSGFDPRGTLVVRTNFDRARYPQGSRRNVVQRELLERFSHLPGMTGVAAASHLPLSDERQIGIRLEHAAPDDFHWAANSHVSPGYFRTMGIPLLRAGGCGEPGLCQPIPGWTEPPRAAFLLGGSRSFYHYRSGSGCAYRSPRCRSSADGL
jgi:hypothetical protein